MVGAGVGRAVEGVVADGAGCGGAAEAAAAGTGESGSAGCGRAGGFAAEVASGESVVEVVGCGGGGGAGRLREATIDANIHTISISSVRDLIDGQSMLECSLPSVKYHLRNQATPAALMGGTESATTVSVEEFVEPQVVFPVRVVV